MAFPRTHVTRHFSRQICILMSLLVMHAYSFASSQGVTVLTISGSARYRLRVSGAEQGIRFGNVTVGSPASSTIQFVNRSRSTVRIILSNVAAPFQISGSRTVTLRPRKSATRTITFMPRRPGAIRTTLNLAASKKRRISITGTGVGKLPLIAIFAGRASQDDRTVDIGTVLKEARLPYPLQLVNPSDRTQMVTVATSGSMTLALPAQAQFTINPHDSATLPLLVSAPSEGTHQSTISISNSDQSLVINLTSRAVSRVEERVAVIVLRYPNSTAQSVDDVGRAVFTSRQSLAAYFDEVSFGKMQLVGSVFGPFDMPAQSQACPSLDAQAAANLIASQINPSQFTKFFLVHYENESNCQVAGSSSFGREPYVFDGREYSASIAQSYSPFYLTGDYSGTTQSTMAHELIHGMGINFHALSYSCSDQTLTRDGANCQPIPYGDLFDMMGLRSAASHPSPFIKQRLGWISSSSITQITQSGMYSLDASDLPRSTIRALEIPLDQPIPLRSVGDQAGAIQIRSLMIETRSLSGFDARNRREYQSETGEIVRMPDSQIEGLLIRAIGCSSEMQCFPYLLDMHPNSLNEGYPPNEFLDAALRTQETFTIPGSNMAIQNLGLDNQGRMHVAVRR